MEENCQTPNLRRNGRHRGLREDDIRRTVDVRHVIVFGRVEAVMGSFVEIE
jgi:hypothetical protein